MLGFHSHQSYFVCTTPVDMGKGIDGLCGVVRHLMEEYPMSGYVFIFFNRDRDKVKLLVGILDHAHTELGNNLIENKIRPLALGRKSYLFAGPQDAAQRIAMMYSFFGSCRAQDINP